MPILPTKPSPLTETEKQRLAEMAQNVNAMALGFQDQIALLPVKHMVEIANALFEPIKQMQDCAYYMTEPIRKMQESLNKSFTVFAKALDITSPMINAQREIAANINSKLELSLERLASIAVLPSFPNISEIIEAEIEEEQGIHNLFLSLPQPLERVPEIELAPPVPKKLARRNLITGTDYDFGITITVEGRFAVKGKLIKNLFTSSKHGKFFEMLLKSPNNYVLDVDVISKLEIVDEDKGIGYIRNDLIEVLARNDLQIDLYRQRKTGYRLIRIKKISN